MISDQGVSDINPDEGLMCKLNKKGTGKIQRNDSNKFASFHYCNPVLARIRKTVKNSLQRLPTKYDAIVVASFGRAGSTLVYDAIVEAMSRARFGSDLGLTKRIVRDVAFNDAPEVLRPGTVYKTHQHPGIFQGTRLRAVFLFGSAKDSALSVIAQQSIRGDHWVKKHFANLSRSYCPEGLLKEDVLGFREQCATWMGYQSFPVLCMRYETLWDNINELSAFCELNVLLPPYKRRAENLLSLELIEQATLTYKSLDDKLDTLPDCFIAAPKFSKVMEI